MRILANGTIRVPDTYDDLLELWRWMESQHTLAVDTETTGLDIYAEDHRLRLIALATPKEAWVFPFETLFAEDAHALYVRLANKRLIMHNASYDIQVIVRHDPSKLWTIEQLWSKTRDTRLIAHQADPRGRDEGGIGQTLEELLKHHVPECFKLGEDLKNEFLRLKREGAIPKSATLADMWRQLPIDNVVYNIYAGTDAIGTARLFQILQQQVDINSELTRNDHKDAMIACLMDANGFLLDREYTEKLSWRLQEEEQSWKDCAKRLGVENINSTQQVSAWFAGHGIETPKTAKGNPSVDDVFLKSMIDRPSHGPNPPPLASMAQAIIEGKKALKWRKTWVEKFLHQADIAGRVHPSTNTLRARTARFSITGIPAQTLPSSDALIRSCFVADMNEVIVGVDYAQQELRFAAAMAPDARMIKAFRNGEDLHYITAETAWPGRGMEMRKYGKGGNFGTVYGGGASALMRQFGMTFEQATAVIKAIKKAYPGLRKMGERLAAEAAENGFITTWTGRKLPVDQDRLYAALNYFIQSGCRDITTAAMRRLYDAGFVDYMRLVIHDEILFSLPQSLGDVAEVVRLMSTTVGKLELPAEAKIGKRSWGSLYEKE